MAESSSRMRRTPLWAWALLAALASGGLLALCFWPTNWHFLAWVALVPWLMMLPRVGAVGAWLCGTVLGLVFYRIGLDWVYGLYGPIGTIVIVFFAVLMGLSFLVARRLICRFGLGAILWAAPVCFVGQEIMRCEGLPLLRFSHLALGYSQIHFPAVAQIASLGGVYLLSFLAVAFNAAVAYGIIRRWWFSWLPAATVAACVAVLAAVSQPRSYVDRPLITVAAVQEEKRDYRAYAEWVRRAATDDRRPAIIVLPEHTIIEFGRNDDDLPLLDDLKATARAQGVYICVGAHTPPPLLGPTDRRRILRDPKLRKKFFKQCWFDNSALLIGPEGRIVFKQLKAVPVPFYSDGNPAETHASYAAPMGRIGMYVCYDESFTDVMRRFVDAGAEILLGPVFNRQDWPLAQRMQQADMMPMRAIETRRCMVRAASSGVSQIIDAAGRVRASRLQREGPGLLIGQVYFNDERTFFVRYGWLFAWAVELALVAAAALMVFWDLGQGTVRLIRWLSNRKT